MKIDRVVVLVAATVLSVSGLGACSSNEQGTDDVVVGASGAGALSPEQQEVADAVEGYFAAFYGRGDTGVEAAVKNRVTSDVAAFTIPAAKEAVEDKGLAYYGDVTVEPTAITIDGDAARYTGCSDGSRAFLAKAGEDAPGVGATQVGSAKVTFGLVRQNGRWLISDPLSEKVDAC